MSPIGRAFIVVNLFLAGGFVFFAGAYHQTQQSNLEKYTEAKAAWDETEKGLNADLASLTTRVNEAEAQKVTLSNQNDDKKAQIESLDAQIVQKEKQLESLSDSIQSIESSAATMATQIDKSTERAGQAYEDAIAAQKAADAARAELSRAQGEIQDKERMIAELSRTNNENQALIADLSQDVRDKDTLIALAATKVPGIFANGLTPPMDGTVTEAADGLVTIKVANNPSEAGAEKFRGGLIAIYDASGYKGDVSVTDARSSGDSLYLFGRMFVEKDGASVRAGDRATTNTN